MMNTLKSFILIGALFGVLLPSDGNTWGVVGVSGGVPSTSSELTVYSTTADGYVRNQNLTTSDYATVRSAATGITSGTSDSTLEYSPESITYSGTPQQWYLGRIFLYIPLTDAALTGKTIDSVVLYFTTTTASMTGTSPGISAQKGTQADTLATTDFDSFSGSEYGHVTYANTSTLSITFNATGISDAQSAIGSTLKLCLRDFYYDYSNNSPGTSGTAGNQLSFTFADNATGKPYVVITYH